jgi:hypothetical protein
MFIYICYRKIKESFAYKTPVTLIDRFNIELIY